MIFWQILPLLNSAGRMHHAWLLTGPVGIGKASMARLAAAWLLSEDAQPEALSGMENPDIKIDVEDAWHQSGFERGAPRLQNHCPTG